MCHLPLESNNFANRTAGAAGAASGVAAPTLGHILGASAKHACGPWGEGRDAGAQVNKPYLPLASGEFSMRTAAAVVAATGAAALALGFAARSGPLMATPGGQPGAGRGVQHGPPGAALEAAPAGRGGLHPGRAVRAHEPCCGMDRHLEPGALRDAHSPA